MKILLVSQMYPGPRDPDLGAFVQGIERALAECGEIERAVAAGRGGGKRRHLRLARDGAARFDENSDSKNPERYALVRERGFVYCHWLIRVEERRRKLQMIGTAHTFHLLGSLALSRSA